jgi:hypothetical protein
LREWKIQGGIQQGSQVLYPPVSLKKRAILHALKIDEADGSLVND